MGAENKAETVQAGIRQLPRKASNCRKRKNKKKKNHICEKLSIYLRMHKDQIHYLSYSD